MKASDVRVGDLMTDGNEVINVFHHGERVYVKLNDGYSFDQKLDTKLSGINHTEHTVPMKGDTVRVSMNKYTWNPRIYLFQDKGVIYCVDGQHEECFRNGQAFRTSNWNYCDYIPPADVITITVSVNGITTKLSDISEETLLAIRAKN